METRMRFVDQLAYANKHEIPIDVEGVSYLGKPPQDVVRIMQRGSYMVDYDSDQSGRITAIHVNSVGRC